MPDMRNEEIRKAPTVVAARYDSAKDHIVLELSNAWVVAFPPRDAQEIERAAPSQLENIEINPSGLSVYFPEIDADVYVPGLLADTYGTRRLVATRLSKNRR
jgi:hypothetical protein